MADCSDIFISFSNSLSLTRTAIRYLRAARTSVKKKITKYLSGSTKPLKVEFRGQGSFTMDTIIKPLAGEYDLDLGVYIKEQSKWREDWPAPETISQRLKDALKNHTSQEPINKKKCVRLIYQPIDKSRNISYHVDLPIYIQHRNFWGDTVTRIGINGPTQWSQISDPIGLAKWFNKTCQKNSTDKNQLIRIVKYIKAWKSFKSSGTKFPSGIALTVLMANSYSPHERDDIAFRETIRKAYNSYFSWYGLVGMEDIINPVVSGASLIEGLNKKQKDNFKTCFEQLVDDAKIAVQHQDRSSALMIWEKHFDTRFKSLYEPLWFVKKINLNK